MKQGLECGVLNTLPRSKVPARHILRGCVGSVEHHGVGGRLFAEGRSSSWRVRKAYVDGEMQSCLKLFRICNIWYLQELANLLKVAVQVQILLLMLWLSAILVRRVCNCVQGICLHLWLILQRRNEVTAYIEKRRAGADESNIRASRETGSSVADISTEAYW